MALRIDAIPADAAAALDVDEHLGEYTDTTPTVAGDDLERLSPSDE